MDLNVKRVERCADTGGEEDVTEEKRNVTSAMWALKTPLVLNANKQKGHLKHAVTARPVASSPGTSVSSTTRTTGTRTGLLAAPGRKTVLLRVPGLEVAREGASRMEGQNAAMEPTATEL